MRIFKKRHGNLITETKSEVLYANDILTLTCLPSKSCYNAKLSDSVEVRLKYVRNRIREQHESIIEHTNVCILIGVKNHSAHKIIPIIGGFRYLNVEVSITDKTTYLLIGGSIRGYKHLIRETIDQNNAILVQIKNCLYDCCYREFFIDLIEAGVMRDSFIDPGLPAYTYDDAIAEDMTDEQLEAFHQKMASGNTCNPLKSPNDRVEIINIDSIQTIYHKVAKYGFTIDQCINMASVTILFKNMSRIITQQLVRHRNAITQESQRYVDYSKSGFNSPTLFKPGKYDADKLYHVDLNMCGHENEICLGSRTLQELGDILCQIYGKLVDQGVEKEDARGYLPLNVQSSKIYMTFTYRTLLVFLKLRTDKHAQAEIREYANIIDSVFHTYIDAYAPCMRDYESLYIPRCMKVECAEYQQSIIDEELEYSESTEADVVEDLLESLPVDEQQNAELFRSEYNSADTSKYVATRDDSINKGDI